MKQQLTLERNISEKLLKNYQDIKVQLDNLRDQVTLRKFYLLSKAMAIGKKLYGKHIFSERKLSIDMDVPYTTVKRCLSLSRANNRTWKLIKDKKISAFKVAMILLTKNRQYQDDVVDLVIKEKLSTYKLKKLRIRKDTDIRKEKQRLAIEDGYKEKRVAYSSFSYAITRLNNFLIINKNQLNSESLISISKKLKDTRILINKFLGEEDES